MTSSLRFPAYSGWVYIIITNQIDNKTVCKVGGTKRAPTDRLAELTHQYDLFDEPPVLHRAVYVSNVWQVEHIAHQILNEQYISNELFMVDPLTASNAVDSAADIYSLLIK